MVTLKAIMELEKVASMAKNLEQDSHMAKAQVVGVVKTHANLCGDAETQETTRLVGPTLC